MKNVITPADILLPASVDMTKWSVVACDQYTSQPEYWKRVADFIGDAPSTCKIVFPEVYLETADTDKTISKINRTMEEYLPKMFVYENAVILVKRTFPSGLVRTGIVAAVDLEEYDFNKGATSPIRATEGTVLERIPPRVRVRENAPLESPHVMLLINDKEKTIIESAAKDTSGYKCVYNFDLMENGGHIEGYLLDTATADSITYKLNSLTESADAPLVFAVGDGNHSLATAKTCYENIKKTLSPEKALVHPSRYALVEVVNLHEDSLVFEPIHRVVFDCDPHVLITAFQEFYQNNNSSYPAQSFEIHYEGKCETVTIDAPSSNLEVGTLQNFLNEYQKTSPLKVDYVHGDNVTRELGNKKGNIGFILPPMPKSALFETVIKDGVLPRKTFSMGEAHEKRFYLECRKIK